MAISRVNFFNAVSSFSSVSVVATGVTAGDTLLIGLMWYSNTATVTSVTVSSNSDATIRGTKIGPASGVNNANIAWYVLDNVATGGSLTVQANFSSTVDCDINVWDLSGAATTAYDTSLGVAETTGANASTSLTAGASSGGLFACIVSNGAEPTNGATFTPETTGNQFYYESAEYKLGAGSGSQTIDWAHSSSTWVMHTISLLNAGGGGGSPNAVAWLRA